MPAELQRLRVISSPAEDETEDQSATLPTTMPDTLLRSTSPEVIEAGSAIDRSYERAFLDSGNVTINGELFSPSDGALSKWISGGTTYVPLCNDGLLVGLHLVPYPDQCKWWMQKHNIVIWQ